MYYSSQCTPQTVWEAYIQTISERASQGAPGVPALPLPVYLQPIFNSNIQLHTGSVLHPPQMFNILDNQLRDNPARGVMPSPDANAIIVSESANLVEVATKNLRWV